MKKSSDNFIPVLLCGGNGTRLYPLSRRDMPKQFLDLNNAGYSLFQQTALRLQSCPQIMVVGAHNHRFIIAEQLAAINMLEKSVILLEPSPKDSCAAIICAAIYAQNNFPQQNLIFCATDHYIKDSASFIQDCHLLNTIINQEYIGVFGIKPSHAATEYGYIQPSEQLGENCFGVARFIEKPDKNRAMQYIKENYYWNSGNFGINPDYILALMAKFHPESLAFMKDSVKNGEKQRDFFWLSDDFLKISAISFDYAIMERNPKTAVLVVNWQWSDIGNFNALSQLLPKDKDNNACLGAVQVFDAHDNHIHSGNDFLTIAVGIDNCQIIIKDSVALICHNDHLDKIKNIVGLLTQNNHHSVHHHQRITRPWGYYTSLDNGTHFQVKRLAIKTGAKISLQKHFHRSEHWVVVKGVAKITLNDKEFYLNANESVYIPKLAMHRIENAGQDWLEIIEVQTGEILDESDIQRFDDEYGRIK